ncbi:MAG: glycosyltransferase [Flavobacteriales bacterium]|nr:glycosyltransferase [Flavobacteriales bacterium]
MDIFYLFLSLLALWYLVVFLSYRLSWNKIPNAKNKNDKDFVSVIVACRNEEGHIANLIQQIRTQNFDKNRFELIVVNDHSTDDTLSILEKKAAIWNKLKIVCLGEGEEGKKTAIEKGISFAKGDIILCTDADCSVEKNWIATIIHYFTDEKIKMVSAPVLFENKKGIFCELQSLEFLSLIGSGAAAIGRGKSIFCNGANFAYRRSVFLEVDSFDNNIASGDDVFLMHKVKQKYANGIAFAKQKEAIVKTSSQPNISAFINQRKRWASKSSSYKDFDTIAISVLVFLMNVSIVTLLVMAFFYSQMIALFAALFLVKYIADYLFLLPVLKFFKKRNLAFWILPFEIFYCFYIILIVILSFTSSFEWKGRIHKK